MFDFLAETIKSDHISVTSGKTETLSWSRPAPGVITFEPNAATDKSVVISVGVHGNETAPIEIVSALVNHLIAGKRLLKVRLLVIIGNLEAMRQGQRYLTIDMNRLFSDHYLQHGSCYETQRAQQLQEIMQDFYGAAQRHRNLHFDLHTAIRTSQHLRFGLLPYLDNGQYDPHMIDWLQNIGLEAVVINHAPAATFSYFSSNQCDAASCTLELGKASPFGHNDLQQFTGIKQGLVNLISGQKPPLSSSSELQVYKVAKVLTKSSEQFKLNLDEQVKNFTAFNKGFILYEDHKNQYPIQQETAYILFPNNHVKVGFRAGLLLQKAQLSEIISPPE